MNKISSSSRYWIVGCIRFENQLATFTPINKFSWKNPQDYKDQVESCSTEPNITRRPWLPDLFDQPVVVDDFGLKARTTRRPYDSYADGWGNYWENSLKSGNNILIPGEPTPKPLPPPGPAKPQQPAPPPGRWNPWHKLSWRG